MGFGEEPDALPILVAARSAVRVAAPGQSCAAACAEQGQLCNSADIPFLNSCRALRMYNFCEKCQANVGSDQPALVVKQSNHYFGSCLFNEDFAQYPPSCDAAHRDTRRLCPCR